MKTCSRCHDTKPPSEFNKRTKALDGLNPWCRPCSKAHYQGNKDRHLANVSKRKKRLRIEIRTAIVEYLNAHPCVDCGNDDLRVLEFDHVRGDKLDSISKMVGDHVSWTRISAEIEKCEVRCANCHRIRTREQFGWFLPL